VKTVDEWKWKETEHKKKTKTVDEWKRKEIVSGLQRDE
jgi:hypothetical protein